MTREPEMPEGAEDMSPDGVPFYCADTSDSDATQREFYAFALHADGETDEDNILGPYPTHAAAFEAAMQPGAWKAPPTAADFASALDAYRAAKSPADWQPALEHLRSMVPAGLVLRPNATGSALGVLVGDDNAAVATFYLNAYRSRVRDERLTRLAWSAIQAMGAALTESSQ